MTRCRLPGRPGWPGPGFAALVVAAVVVAVKALLTTVFVRRRALHRGPGQTYCRRVVYALQARQLESGSSGRQGAADAPLAQSAERLHGKEKVYGSIP